MSDEPLIAGPESTVAHALLRREPDHVRRIDWSYAGGIALLHLLALLALVPWLFSWTGVLLVPIGMYTFGTLGINVGLHRLLTHRSLACPRWLERTLVLLGTCGWMDSPAYWVAVHRRHHQFADEEHDPHSPIESFFWSHLGWYMVKIDPERRAELVQRYAKTSCGIRYTRFSNVTATGCCHRHLVARVLRRRVGRRAGDRRQCDRGRPVRRQRVGLGRLRAGRGGVPHHHERKLVHPSVGLPQLPN